MLSILLQKLILGSKTDRSCITTYLVDVVVGATSSKRPKLFLCLLKVKG